MSRPLVRLALVAALAAPALAHADEPIADDAPVPRVTTPPSPLSDPPAPTPPPLDPSSGRTLSDDELADLAAAEAERDQTGETIVLTDRWQGAAQTRRESAEAVVVVETDQASRESADLGEVLARVQGVGVRRSGGLGSAARLSLAGLADDQVRTFLDGMPLELVGFTQGVATVPVNFIERIEVYRGVVPVRFGADALAGVIDLVSDQTWYGTQAMVSYQLGSFGTQRVTAAARHRTGGGLVARADVFVDDADNDYTAEVPVADDRGTVTRREVPRHNDEYRAYGAFVEAGVVDQPWARRLLLRGYATRYQKGIPHNIVMEVPYGEASHDGTAVGGVLQWEDDEIATTGVAARAVVGAGRRSIHFVDRSPWVYDWYGNRLRMRPMPGEIELPHDRTTWNTDAWARLDLERTLGDRHVLRATAAPTFTRRTGEERLLSEGASRDPESARRDLLTSVVGVEHEVDAWDERLENLAFAKYYLQVASSEEVLPSMIFVDRERRSQRAGIGDSLRWRFTPWLWGKASYEWATRLPRPDEIFGDGVLIKANLALEPESSHNVNLGAAVSASSPTAGAVRGELMAFGRFADDFITVLGADREFSSQNVFAARSLGADLALGWTAPSEWLALDLTATYVDLRNVSDDGAFSDYQGDRIPNRPWLTSAGGVTLSHGGLLRAGDMLSGSFNSRFVGKYYRAWQSLGREDSKQFIDWQLVHSAVVTYRIEGAVDGSISVELSNLTDELAFDFYGVQRPGRALSMKATLEY